MKLYLVVGPNPWFSGYDVAQVRTTPPEQPHTVLSVPDDVVAALAALGVLYTITGDGDEKVFDTPEQVVESAHKAIDDMICSVRSRL